MRRTSLPIAAAILALAPAAAAAAPQAGIAGRWATEGFGSIVELAPCAAEPGTVCGRIVWLWRPAEGNRPRADEHNPDPALRGRPLVGVEIVRGLRQGAPGVWTGGRLYNPDDGRTYDGAVRLRDGVLELQGCALKVLCRTQTWRRPEDIAAAAR